MSKSPAFQFYAAEYLADEDVQLMTLEEEGCYIRLLAYCWREGSIPSDLEKLSRLCKGASTIVVRVVLNCFYQDPTNTARMLHKRLEVERVKQREWKEKSARGGRKSAEVRANAEVRTNRELFPNEPPFQPPLEPDGNIASASASSFASSKDQKQTPLLDDEHRASEIEEQIRQIYEAYPRKVAPDAAIKAIKKSIARLVEGNSKYPPMNEVLARRYLWKMTAEYAASPAGQKSISDKDFRPYPSTWFNQGHYFDNVSEWQKPNGQYSGINGGKTNGKTDRSVENLTKFVNEVENSDGDHGGELLPGSGSY